MTSRRGVRVDGWKRTLAGALARLKECEAGMERTRGETINLQWYGWNGEWMEAWDWLEKYHPRVARRLAVEAAAAFGTNVEMDGPA